MVLVVGHRHFPVHSAVVTCRCLYLDMLLASPLGTPQAPPGTVRSVQLNEVDSVEDFAALLYFLYTDTLPCGLHDGNVQGLFLAANKYQVPDLLRHCERLLEARLTEDTVAQVLEMADRTGVTELAEVAAHFATDPALFPAVAATAGFLALPSALQSLVVQGHAKRRNPGVAAPGHGSPKSGPPAVVVPGGAARERAVALGGF